MATGGTRKKDNYADGYENSSYAGLCEEYSTLAKDIRAHEGCDLFGQPALALNNPNVVASLENFWLKDSYDPVLYDGTHGKTYNQRALQEHISDMKELFKNDVEAITEYTAMNSVNPIVTTGLPMHKLIMLKNIFKQGIIQTNVAVEPRFTIKMQHRYLVKPDGTALDLVLDQDKITDAFNSINPVRTITLDFTGNICNTASLASGSRLVEQCGGILGRDNLNTDLAITAIYVEMPTTVATTLAETATVNVSQGAGSTYPDKGSDTAVTDGSTSGEWGQGSYNVGATSGGYTGVKPAAPAPTTTETTIVKLKKNIMFTPQYGPNNVQGFTQIVDLSAYLPGVNEMISGTLVNNEIMLTSGTGYIKKVDIRVQLDPSNAMLSTCKAKWGHDETYVVIPNRNPMNIPISPEEVKDIQAMYGVSQLSMYMSIINDVLGNVKDDTIRRELYASYDSMPSSERRYSWFDFEPREGYNRDHVSWRYASFMDLFDTFVTSLLYILNDEDVTVSVFGRPDIIRKITPTDYSYQAPSSVGPVDLEFTRTIATSDNRVYNFISSQKLGNSNDLTVILNPNNSERIIYRVYDYQFYISNEIRNAENYTLPGIHAFERFKFMEYQPVQGKFRIFNPSGRNDQNSKYTDQIKDLAGIE